jgi:hypothetical protein
VALKRRRSSRPRTPNLKRMYAELALGSRRDQGRRPESGDAVCETRSPGDAGAGARAPVRWAYQAVRLSRAAYYRLVRHG